MTFRILRLRAGAGGTNSETWPRRPARTAGETRRARRGASDRVGAPRLCALPHRPQVSTGPASTYAPLVRSPAFSAAHSDVAAPVTAYQGIKGFSYVVLAMMLAGIVYASIIAVTYWTGISV